MFHQPQADRQRRTPPRRRPLAPAPRRADTATRWTSAASAPVRETGGNGGMDRQFLGS